MSNINDEPGWERRRRKLIDWFRLEYEFLQQRLGRFPTLAEQRARAHAVVDAEFDDYERMRAEAEKLQKAAAAKVVPLPVVDSTTPRP
jgi:hypothetical protein